MKHPYSLSLPGDRFGAQVAQHLSQACTDLDHDIAERLRAARQQALERRKVELASTCGLVTLGHSATLQLGDAPPGLWARCAAALPLLALAGGLLAIAVVQNDNRADELAEIDAALLTDDLPTSAYTDPGFLQFLKAGRSAEQH
ncbi:DUF3619 family protein [Pseudorhodoferax sp.]|uniref:DUF3619 family protein n=1 Tax=Pseudorhodoferax sp. TaxID=1993553 RepID=UPI0039E3CE52